MNTREILWHYISHSARCRVFIFQWVSGGRLRFHGKHALACHQKHGQHTRASCSTCHPRLSNCGLDVEKMDTTFASTKSPHNIHFVKCLDCHPKGIPKKRPASARASSSL